MLKCLLLSHRLVVALTTGLLLALMRPAAAQRAIPDSAPLSNFNPLCEGSLVHCLEIDHFAGHVYGHLQVLPKTDLRAAAAIVPLGVTLGIFGRIAGGISTYYSFWKEGDALYQQLGPVRLHLTGRLLPLFPLFSSGGNPESSGHGDSHDTPPRGLQLGFAYEHEVRVGPFSGANSLGILADLASLYLVGSKMLGPFQVSANLGALYDWRGSFATGVASGQLALFIPGFKAFKVFVEGMGRGAPAYAKKNALPPMPDGQDPIHPQGMVGGGFAFRPNQRVDLGVEVLRGFGGGLASWVVGVNFLVLSVGERYEGHAAAPLAQLAADATVGVASSIHAYIQSLPIDPVLDERCMLLDDNGDLMMDQPIGTRTADGKHCMVQGEKLSIGEHWWRDKKKSVVCRDKKYTDCLMYRRPGAPGYRVLHRPWVGDDCVLRESVYDPRSPEPTMTPRAVELAVLGSLTKDRQGCTDPTGHVHTVGTQYYREHGHLWICTAPRIEEQRDRCFLALTELPQTMHNQVTPVGRIARALDHGLGNKAATVDKLPGQIVATAEDVAEGRITLDTITGALKAKAEDIARHATTDDAERWLNGKIDGIKSWTQKPTVEQGEDLAEEVGDTMIPHPVAVGAAVLTGGTGRGALHVAEELEDVAKAGKKIQKVATSTAIQAEKKAVSAVKAAGVTVSKADSPIWKRLKPAREKTKTDGKRYFEWDHTHGDIEVYDKRGRHLGSMDPITGAMSKPPVSGRSIDL